MAALNGALELALGRYSQAAAQKLKADVFSIKDGIILNYLSPFRRHMEALAESPSKHDNLMFFINTLGGVVKIVEKIVTNHKTPL